MFKEISSVTHKARVREEGLSPEVHQSNADIAPCHGFLESQDAYGRTSDRPSFDEIIGKLASVPQTAASQAKKILHGKNTSEKYTGICPVPGTDVSIRITTDKESLCKAFVRYAAWRGFSDTEKARRFFREHVDFSFINNQGPMVGALASVSVKPNEHGLHAFTFNLAMVSSKLPEKESFKYGNVTYYSLPKYQEMTLPKKIDFLCEQMEACVWHEFEHLMQMLDTPKKFNGSFNRAKILRNIGIALPILAMAAAKLPVSVYASIRSYMFATSAATGIGMFLNLLAQLSIGWVEPGAYSAQAKTQEADLQGPFQFEFEGLEKSL